MSSSLAGAEMTTVRAPASRCLAALARSVNRPVDSTTTSTPKSFQGRAAGSLLARTLISLPLTTKLWSLAATVPAKAPCTESYRSRWPSVFASVTVIAVRLDVGGERPQNGGRVSVDVREREHGRRFARGAGAGADGAHDGRPYPPTAFAASIPAIVSLLPNHFRSFRRLPRLFPRIPVR